MPFSSPQAAFRSSVVSVNFAHAASHSAMGSFLFYKRFSIFRACGIRGNKAYEGMLDAMLRILFRRC